MEDVEGNTDNATANQIEFSLDLEAVQKGPTALLQINRAPLMTDAFSRQGNECVFSTDFPRELSQCALGVKQLSPL